MNDFNRLSSLKGFYKWIRSPQQSRMLFPVGGWEMFFFYWKGGINILFSISTILWSCALLFTFIRKFYQNLGSLYKLNGGKSWERIVKP